MVGCTNTGNSRGVFHRLEQTSKFHHYGPWHSHDSAPRMGPSIGLVEVQKRSMSLCRLWHAPIARMGNTLLFSGCRGHSCRWGIPC